LNALQYCRCSLGQHLRRNVISSWSTSAQMNFL
jgi:hypothetical protein